MSAATTTAKMLRRPDLDWRHIGLERTHAAFRCQNPVAQTGCTAGEFER
jgi:hypothetical protein